jgi:hypothetical protein
MQCFPGLNQEKNSRMRRLDAYQRRVQGRVVKSCLASTIPRWDVCCRKSLKTNVGA